MRAHSFGKFNIFLVEVCSIDALPTLEIEWIAKLDAYKNGYNGTPGGEGRPSVDREQVIKVLNIVRTIKGTCNILGNDPATVRKILLAADITPLAPGDYNQLTQSKRIIQCDKMTGKHLKIHASIMEATRYLREQTNNHELSGKKYRLLREGKENLVVDTHGSLQMMYYKMQT